MAIARRLLNDGEEPVVTTRTHVKALLVPALVLIVVAAVAGWLSSLPSGDLATPIRWVVGAVALVLVAAFVVRPVLAWLTTSYTVTTRRLLTRTGILNRSGHDIPLARISDVAYERSLLDRMLGCGTLVVSDASTHGSVTLPDIPHVEQVHQRLSELLYRHVEPQPVDDGT